MPREQRKEPWNSEIYPDEKHKGSNKSENRGGKKKHKEEKERASTLFLTFLVVVMFVIIGVTIMFAVWNSRPYDRERVEQNFYPEASETATTDNSEDVDVDESSDNLDENSEASGSVSNEEGDGYTIVMGDYPSLIASKTGISWETIIELNPDLDPNNPGYYKDGSQLTVGQVLKTR